MTLALLAGPAPTPAWGLSSRVLVAGEGRQLRLTALTVQGHYLGQGDADYKKTRALEDAKRAALARLTDALEAEIRMKRLPLAFSVPGGQEAVFVTTWRDLGVTSSGRQNVEADLSIVYVLRSTAAKQQSATQKLPMRPSGAKPMTDDEASGMAKAMEQAYDALEKSLEKKLEELKGEDRGAAPDPAGGNDSSQPPPMP